MTFVDISERLKVEEELRQTEKMLAPGKLSAGLVHELNNPASDASRGSIQLLDALGELPQRMATVLNLRNGSDPSGGIVDTVKDARDFLFAHPTPVTRKHSDRQDVLDLKDLLDAYNNSGE